MTTPFTASFCSMNVRGLNQMRKRRQLFRWLHNNKFDNFLQETFSSRDIETVWKSEWGGDILYSHGTNHSRGVMILFNPKLVKHVDHVEADKYGRFLLLQVTIHNTSFYLCNIYSPNNISEQKTFFSNLQNILINACATDEIIIGGDFNCSLKPQDKIGGCAVNKKHNESMQVLETS